ncbi:hypothetical protein KAU34_00180 [candidate division WOR-3 bacterium]|nr:hypothetical protein [candidate division WOR-3 bacterium]
MKLFFLLFLAILLISSQVTAVEILTNGDFEQPLTNGWDESVSASNYTINRATNYDPDPDYEARVYQGTGSGYARLYQIVDIPATNLDFSANAKLYAWDNSGSAWAGAGLVLSYFDYSVMLLGETYICARSTQCPWSNSSTTHIIEAADSAWHDYSFNIENELTNLSGVNPSDVKKIRVSLYTQIYHC